MMPIYLAYPRASMLIAVVCGAMGVGLLSAGAPFLGAAAIGAAGLIAILVASRSFALAIVFMSGTVDLFTDAKAGPISYMGLLTILYALGSWFFWLLRPRWGTYRASIVLPLMLFIAWAGLSVVLWYRPTVAGFQNLLVFAAIVGFMLLGASESRTDPRFRNTLGITLQLATLLSIALYSMSRILDIHPFGLEVSDRSFSLFALVGLAWCLAGWRCGSRSSFWTAVAILMVIGVSLSRTAFAAGLILFPLAQFKGQTIRGWLRLLVWILLAAGLLYAAVSYIEPLRERFFQGDLSLDVGGIAVNASGRTKIWEATYASFRESPWIGKGAGSSMVLVNALFPGLGHPHNDYLRFLHDYGLIGFGIFMTGYLGLLWRTWRAWLVAERNEDDTGQIHLAAFLALISVAIGMLTDNVIVYIFVMAPLGVLIGASLGTMGRDRVPDTAQERHLHLPQSGLPLHSTVTGCHQTQKDT